MAILPLSTKESTVVDMLRNDHEKVKALFRDFKAAHDDDRKQSIVQQATSELEIHSAVEEKVFYPAVRRDSPDAGEQLDESFEEHHVVKFLIGELKKMSPTDERFDAKFRVLAENVRHHIKEEEAELFARARTGSLDLVRLGAELEAAKAAYRAATKEHRSRSANRPAITRKTGSTHRPQVKQPAKKAKKRTEA